jgi:hypothetical protein
MVVDIDLIAGDTSNGVITYSRDPKELKYRFEDDGPGVWRSLALPDFEIEGLCGDNRHGIAAYGNARTVAYMNKYQENKWHPLHDAPFDISGITGDNSRGVAVYGGENDQQVAYEDNYRDPMKIITVIKNGSYCPMRLFRFKASQATMNTALPSLEQMEVSPT